MEEPKLYKLKDQWLTKKEIKTMVEKEELLPLGKIKDALFYGFCLTGFKNAIVKIKNKISILTTFTNNGGEFFESRGRYYFKDMVEYYEVG